MKHMTEFHQVTRPEPEAIAFLHAHKERLGDVPPLAIFVAERNSDVIAALLVWTDPIVHVALIMEEPRPFVLYGLVGAFERWAESVGVTQYGFAVHESDERYLRIIRRLDTWETGQSEDGYIRFVKRVGRLRLRPDQLRGSIEKGA